MRILGIETSCDDTAIGIVSSARGRFTIEAQVAASQVIVHRRFGGVVPEIAAREHAVTIWPTIFAGLERARVTWEKIDAVAVTAGPGLSTALAVGVEAARVIGFVKKKPIVRINHIEGHVMSTVFTNGKLPRFPALALIVSGGHTELIAVDRPGRYRLLGKTIDDAAGEAFDKVGKLLKLPYPGGAEISRLAQEGDRARFAFPRALFGSASLDFSYSGLKTAVLYETLRYRKIDRRLRADLAASFQAAALAPLFEKTRRALRQSRYASLLIGGGVAANQELRRELREILAAEFPTVELRLAPHKLCVDNGVMIAAAGIIHARRRRFTDRQRLAADPGWELVE